MAATGLLTRERPATPARHAAGWLAPAALVLLVFTLRLPSFFEPHHYGDEGIFAATAQRWLQGEQLYTGSWDDKPPFVFVVYAAMLWAFGPSMLALRLLGTLWAAATALVVLAIGRRMAGERAGWIAALLYAVLAALPLTESTLLLTEALLALPAAGGVLLVLSATTHHGRARDARLLAAGALLGVAFLFKQVAAFDAAAVGLWLLLRRDRPLRDAAWLVAGWAVPVSATALWLGLAGALPDAWQAVFGFYGLYLREGSALPLAFSLIKLAPVALTLAWLLYQRRTHDPDGAGLILLWFSFALLGVTLAGRPFGHYLVQLFAPAALVVGWLVTGRAGPHPRPLSQYWARGVSRETGPSALEVQHQSLASLSRQRFPLAQYWERGLGGEGLPRLFPLSILLLGLFIVLSGFGGFWLSHPTLRPAYYANWLRLVTGRESRAEHDRFFSWRVPNQEALARLIKADGGERTLFVWGEYPWLYPLADARNPTRFATSYHTSFVSGAKAEVMRALEQQQPRYIAHELEEWRRLPDLQPFLDARYERVTQVDNTVLWRRRE